MSVPWPNSYAAWRSCLVARAGISPSLDYFKERHQSLSDPQQAETKRFRELYGDDRWQTICTWLEQAIREEGD